MGIFSFPVWNVWTYLSVWSECVHKAWWIWIGGGTGDHIGVLHLLLLKLLLLLFTTTPIWKGGSGDHIGVVHLLLLGNGVVKIILECGEYSTFPTNIRNRESFPDHLLFHIKNIIINTERRKLYKCIFDQLNGSIFQRLTRSSSSSRLGWLKFRPTLIESHADNTFFSPNVRF